MEIIDHNIKVFLKVAEAGSITKAAKELYISQPAVSKAIGKLEEEFGVQLFIRDRRSGLQLTEKARRILPVITRLLENEKELARVIGEQQRIRVAAMPIITTAVLSKVLPVFRDSFPDVTVEIIEGEADEINAAVRNGQADIGISIPPFEGLESELLLRDRMVAIYSGEKLTEVDLETDNIPLVMCSIGHEVVSNHIAKSLEQKNHIVVRNSETVISLVKNGNGIGIISEYVLLASDHKLSFCSVKPDISFDYVMIAPSFKKLPQHTRKFAELIKEKI